MSQLHSLSSARERPEFPKPGRHAGNEGELKDVRSGSAFRNSCLREDTYAAVGVCTHAKKVRDAREVSCTIRIKGLCTDGDIENVYVPSSEHTHKHPRRKGNSKKLALYEIPLKSLSLCLRVSLTPRHTV